MPRLKKPGKPVETAQKRLAGQKSIDETLDLGNDLTNAKYDEKIKAALQVLEEYNALQAAAGEKANVYNEIEKDLKAYSERSLKAVGVKYGFDSSEYEMAGGTRKSERKKPKPKLPSELPPTPWF